MLFAKERAQTSAWARQPSLIRSSHGRQPCRPRQGAKCQVAAIRLGILQLSTHCRPQSALLELGLNSGG